MLRIDRGRIEDEIRFKGFNLSSVTMTIKYKSQSNWYVVFINGSHNKTQQSHANELNISQQEIKQVIVIDALQCTVEHAATVTNSIQWIVSIVSLTVSQTLYRDTYRIAARCIVAPLELMMATVSDLQANSDSATFLKCMVATQLSDYALIIHYSNHVLSFKACLILEITWLIKTMTYR